jgi:hypothetical protein
MSSNTLPAVIGLLVVLGGSLAVAQKANPIFTIDHLSATMKMLGPNFRAATASLMAGDYEAAKAQATRTREQLATTITFWRDHERDDAIALLRATVAKIDDLDTALSAETIDPAAVAALAAEVDAACQACHTVYREQDPVTNEYRLKQGSVEERD